MSVERHELTINGEDITYLIISYHRDNSPKKSQWVITKVEEINCFTKSVKKDWTDDNLYFGLKNDGDSLEQLGLNHFKEELYLAKFISSSTDWHGYPADYVRNTQDIPPQIILDKWLKEEIIAKHEMTKIKRGMPCNH